MRTRQCGFTLLEVILVVLIFGIMSAMAYGGLNSVLKTRTAVESSIERTADLQRAYMRMRGDFQNMVLRPIRDNFGDTQPALLGSRDNVVELTRGGWRNPLYLSRSSLERVVYRLADHKLERASYRVLDRAQDSEPVRMPLLDKVDELKLRYMDESNEWTEQWPAQSSQSQSDATEKAPRAVEVTLTTKDFGELRFLFKPGSESAPDNLNQPTSPADSTNTGSTNKSGSDANTGTTETDSSDKDDESQ